MNTDCKNTNSNNSHVILFSKGFPIFFCAFFACFLLVLPILLLSLPKGTFSEDENRVLATLPSFSAEALLDGRYTEQLSAYLCDHLPLRGALLKTKAATELTLLKKENNHVTIARNGSLVKRFSYTNEQLMTLRENLMTSARLGDALSAHGKSVILCAPRAIDVLTDSPAYEPAERSPWTILEDTAPEALTVHDILRGKTALGERVWFRTDHHWTPLGAFYAYEALGEALGYTPYPKSSFVTTDVCHDFLGTTYSSAQIPLVRPDTVTAFRYAKDGQYTCTDRFTGQARTGLYVEEALSKKDKYQYFLGENTAWLSITKNGENARPTLLVIKDSFAQSLVPFLARHFDIELLDLRYFRGDATEAIREITENPNYVGALLLYNADTLTGDAGLGHVDPNILQ